MDWFNPGAFGVGLLVVLFLVVSVAMILIVLIQRPQGGGLSGAFGAASDGAGQTAFGARTGDALTLATIVVFLLFIGTAIGLNYIVKPPQAADPQAAAISEPVPVTTTTTVRTAPAPDDAQPAPQADAPDANDADAQPGDNNNATDDAPATPTTTPTP